MENEPRFDLEPAIASWRRALEPSPSLREGDLQELEAHLRDSIQALESKGLGTEEAFLVATRRVGSSRELEREFGKANPRRLWLDRGLWLLLGFMVFEWINACGAAVGRHITNALLAQGASEYRAGFLSQLITVSIEAGLVLWGWRWLTRRRTPSERWLGDCLRRPWLVALCLVVLNYFRWPLVDGLMGLVAPVTDALLDLAAPWTTPVAGARPAEDAATLTAWHHWGDEARFLFYLVGFVYLARGYARLTGGLSPTGDTVAEKTPAVMETPAVPALERLGLSKPEALFLIHRRTVERVTGSAPDTACRPRIWMERGLWMLTGTFVARVLWSLQDTVGAAMCLLLSGLFLNGQVAGLLTLTLQALALWALTAHLWRRVTGGEPSYSRLGRLILTHPVLTMLGFFCANYALRSLAIWSGTAFSPALSALFAAQGNTFMYWYQGNHELWYNIIPVVLLVWLARGRLRENLVEPCQPQ